MLRNDGIDFQIFNHIFPEATSFTPVHIALMEAQHMRNVRFNRLLALQPHDDVPKTHQGHQRIKPYG